MAEEISTSAFVVGLLKNMNLSSNLANILTYTTDIGRIEEVYNDIQKLSASTLRDAQDLIQILQKDGYNILKIAFDKLPDLLQNLNTIKRNQVLQSTSGFGGTASMLAVKANYYQQSTHISLFESLCFDLPYAIARIKAQRFYQALLRPSRISLNTAITQFNRGNITSMEFNKIMQENGVPDLDIKLLQDEAENYPNVTAFVRYASIMPFTDDAIRWLCKVNNVTLKPVVDYYVNLLHAIRLRDEYTQYVSYLRNGFLDGLMGEDEYLAEIMQHKTDAEEAQQSLTNVKSEMNRFLARQEIQTQTWLYRKGVLLIEAGELDPPETAEDLFYERLVDLGVVAAVSNSIVRLEAAKLAIDWERP
jgi:hypothetical protein